MIVLCCRYVSSACWMIGIERNDFYLPLLSCFDCPVAAATSQVKNNSRRLIHLVHCQAATCGIEEHIVPYITRWNDLLMHAGNSCTGNSQVRHMARARHRIRHGARPAPENFRLQEDRLDILLDRGITVRHCYAFRLGKLERGERKKITRRADKWSDI